MTKQDAIDVKATLNNLLLQTSLISAETKLLSSMVLGVYKETLPNEQYKTIYTNYVNRLDQRLHELLDRIEVVLFDVNDPAFLIRQKFEIHSLIESMKTEDDYLVDLEQ